MLDFAGWAQTQIPGCGGPVNKPNGFIVSPGYSKPYAPNLFCVWSMDFKPTDQVTVSALKFYLWLCHNYSRDSDKLSKISVCINDAGDCSQIFI